MLRGGRKIKWKSMLSKSAVVKHINVTLCPVTKQTLSI